MKYSGLSKLNMCVIESYNKGYRVSSSGNLISFTGKKLKLFMNNQGYYKTTVMLEGIRHVLYVHKLQAYQLYSNEIFKEDILVRHLDGNKLNNSCSNIVLGNQSANMMDRPSSERLYHAIQTSTRTRVLTDEQIKELRRLYNEEGWTYALLMDKYNVKSKGSMWEFIHRSYITKK